MEEEGGPSFEATPSWVIGVVVFVIVGVSLAIDKLLTKLGDVLKRKDKIPLYEALKNIKEELMLMGFVSLLLAFVQDKVIHLCVPEVYVDDWLPCHMTNATTPAIQNRLFSSSKRRLLAVEGELVSSCKEGDVPFIALGVLHDLHYFIFVLAVVHVISCTITVLLGEAKISQWWKWEEAIRNKALDEDDNERNKIIDVKTLPFIMERFEGFEANKRNYVFSFFKHLCGVVTKADYEALRFAFVVTHCKGNKTFNFHQYMVYAYEVDFTSVVTIRWFLWLFAVVSLTLNVAGWNLYFWLSFAPLLFLLVVGTKLEQVITDMASSFANKHTVIIRGETTIQPKDDYFWFKRPKHILLFIHVILFMNSFGFAIFFWTLFKFGFNSCIMGDTSYAIARLVLMIVVQSIFSYSTLPLYAIVTQMGTSHNQEAMFKYSRGSTLGETSSRRSGDLEVSVDESRH